MITDVPGLLITAGEPAGIGPDLVLLLARESIDVGLTVIADPDLLQQRAQQLGVNVRIQTFQSRERHQPGSLQVLPVKLNTPAVAGKLDASNSAYVIETLKQAVQLCLAKQFDAIVTGPVSKAIINDAGIEFTGHTEYFAAECQAELPVMLLANEQLRVALVTTHMPLAEVVKAITPQQLETTLRILHNDLRKYFAIDRPRIAVCGLNPHAGENGHLGDQEQRIIEPVIKKLRSQGFHLSDPLPADTVFTKSVRDQYDVVLSMFHDQGLPTLKALGFGETVNITLGLPIIRTSVDHGTALSLAGSGKANPSSLLAAVNLAKKMVHSTQLQG